MKRSREKVLLTSILALAIVGIVATYFGFIGLRDLASTTRGEIGDFFGGVLGPLLSFLALVLVAWTLRQQIEELEITKELSRQQAFESHFFELIRLHQENVKTLALSFSEKQEHCGDGGIGKLESGRSALQRLYDKLETEFEPIEDKPSPDEGGELTRLLKIYEKFNERYQRDFGHYIRHLYTMVDFLDRAVRNGVVPAEKSDFVTGERIDSFADYCRIIRAQLSGTELALIFYLVKGYELKRNKVKSEPATNKFRKLIEKYGLLKNLDKEPHLFLDGVEGKLHRGFYSESAFRGPDSVDRSAA